MRATGLEKLSTGKFTRLVVGYVPGLGGQSVILAISNFKSLPLSSLDLFIKSAYHPRDRRSCC